MNKEKSYRVEIKETLSRIIDVETDNEVGAIQEAMKQYKNEDIVLSAEDYVKTEFKVYK